MLTGDKQFRGFKSFRKSTAHPVQEQAYSHHGTYTRVIRCIHQGHVCAKTMTDHAHFGRIRSWLRQYHIDGPCQVKRLHAPVRLLSLAITNTPKVEAQGNHTSLCCQALCQCRGQWIMHIASDRLRMTEHNDWCAFHFSRYM